jgi:hypothetical protein
MLSEPARDAFNSFVVPFRFIFPEPVIDGLKASVFNFKVMSPELPRFILKLLLLITSSI